MNTYNIYFNRAWEYLKELHRTFDLSGEALDLSTKPNIKKVDYCKYINAIYTVIIIGNREGFISPHVDGHGHVVYIKFTNSK